LRRAISLIALVWADLAFEAAKIVGILVGIAAGFVDNRLSIWNPRLGSIKRRGEMKLRFLGPIDALIFALALPL
jgi:hypothetical protein